MLSWGTFFQIISILQVSKLWLFRKQFEYNLLSLTVFHISLIFIALKTGHLKMAYILFGIINIKNNSYMLSLNYNLASVFIISISFSPFKRVLFTLDFFTKLLIWVTGFFDSLEFFILRFDTFKEFLFYLSTIHYIFSNWEKYFLYCSLPNVGQCQLPNVEIYINNHVYND